MAIEVLVVAGRFRVAPSGQCHTVTDVMATLGTVQPIYIFAERYMWLISFSISWTHGAATCWPKPVATI